MHPVQFNIPSSVIELVLVPELIQAPLRVIQSLLIHGAVIEFLILKAIELQLFPLEFLVPLRPVQFLAAAELIYLLLLTSPFAFLLDLVDLILGAADTGWRKCRKNGNQDGRMKYPGQHSLSFPGMYRQINRRSRPEHQLDSIEKLAARSVAVCAPQFAVDPYFRELECVGVGFALVRESHPAAAKDRNPPGLAGVIEHDGRPGDPLPRPLLFRCQLHNVAAIFSCGFQRRSDAALSPVQPDTESSQCFGDRHFGPEGLADLGRERQILVV